MKKIIIFLLLTISLVNFSTANEFNYKLTLSNVRQLGSNTLEFEIYLLNEAQQELHYFQAQYSIEFNPNITTFGDLNLTLVNSELPNEFQPVNMKISGNVLKLSTNSMLNNINQYFEISRIFPGTLIATLRLESTGHPLDIENLDFKWSPKIFKTKIAIVQNGRIEEITNSNNHLINSEGRISDEIINEIPSNYSLFQNTPNPFNPETKIKYEIPKSVHVKLVVYDATGKEVQTLVNTVQNAGRYEISFNGSEFASGIYYYKFMAGDFVATRKMLLLK